MSTEISVSGRVPIELRQSVLDRLSNHTHSVCRFASREMAFDRGPLEGLSEDSNMLRLRYVIQTPSAPDSQAGWSPNGWTLISRGRAEPERMSPEYTIRPFYSCPIIEGNPIEFVSALGYRRKFEFYRRGMVFVRGPVVIEVFQVYENEEDDAPIAWPEVHLITVTVTVPSAPRPATGAAQTTGGVQQQELRDEGCARPQSSERCMKAQKLDLFSSAITSIKKYSNTVKYDAAHTCAL